MKNIILKLICGCKALLKEQGGSRTILRIMAGAAIGLMLIGLFDGPGQASQFSIPGPATMSIGQITHSGASQAGLVMMSTGILLFAVLPSLRVLFGINQFIRHHEVINLIAAIIVFIELTLGILMIFHVKGALT